MVLAIHQPQYMPWSGYFHKMASADHFVLLDNVQFKKNEWQHRNRIRGANGSQWLSVPTTYKFPQLISEVEIAAGQQWQEKHLRSIEMCYKKSRYFNNYFPLFESFFDRQHYLLSSCNIASVNLLAGCCHITTPCTCASEIVVEGTSTERLVNICRHFGADTYLAGAGGKEYMEQELFGRAGITVVYQHFYPPRYHQMWTEGENDFIPGLSLIDMLFNCGEETYTFLMKDHRQ